VNTTGVDRRSGKVLIQVAQNFFRPAEADALVGDATKARTRLGWSPEVTLSELVERMVEADLKRAQAGLLLA
jgi:GDPmannose 4,6-dehydratase